MRLLHGHDGPIRCLAYSPDGSTLASVGDDLALLLWDIGSGRVRGECGDENASATCVAYDPGGRTLASGSGTGLVSLWDAETGRLQARYGLSHLPVNDLAFVAGGEFLVAALGDRKAKRSDGQLGFGNIATGHRIVLYVDGGAVGALACEPAGRMMIFGARDRIIVTRGLQGMEALVERWKREAEAGIAGSMSYSQLSYACYSDMIVRTIPRSRSRSVALSPDRRTLAVGAGREVELWESAEGRLRSTLSGHDDEVFSLAFGPDDRTLASVSRDGTVRLWDADEGRPRACHDWEIGRAHSVAFAPDGMTIAAGGDLGIVVWDVDGNNM
jgi:WD40 repeat protein